MKKVKLTPGAHRAFLSRRKGAKDVLFATPFCRCGWRGEETSNTTGAFDQFDQHMKDLKSGKAVA